MIECNNLTVFLEKNDWIQLESHHSDLKGEIPEKKGSKDPSMDSVSKIYFHLDKL